MITTIFSHALKLLTNTSKIAITNFVISDSNPEALLGKLSSLTIVRIQSGWHSTYGTW